MIGEQRIRQLADDLLSYSTANQTEVMITVDETGLTRFANSAIHQNVFEDNAEVRVRAVLGKRIGVATSNSLDPVALRQLVDRAVAIARRQPENPDFVSLPQPRPNQRLNSCDEKTVNCTPEERAEMVRIVCAGALDQGVSAAGALETAAREYAVANSLGSFGYDTQSTASLSTVMMADSGSGYAERNSVFVDALEPEEVAREAIDKALRSRNPVDLPPGEYVTLLEEYAVAEMLFYLGYIGLGALAVQEGRSFMNGRFGQRIADPRIDIWDDGWDPRGFPWSFDFEGVPKQRVEMIKDGVANAVVYDSYTAHREGKESTGHALPAPNSYGPLPLNLFMGTGDATKEQMLASVERGLWVTRFHYVNVVHPTQTVLTGMTRDGTFLIENGQIVGPVKNLRFTQSVLEALSSVRMIGRDAKFCHPEASAVVPALLLDRFRFTGATEF
ncbi:MAG: TldD/PmbA family protein [Chloroflexota bacterium]